MAVTYNEERHEYTLDGKVVPSVTQLVKKFLKLDTSWLEAHPEYAERGTIIHNELAEYFRGERDAESLSEAAAHLAGFIGEPDKEKFLAETLLYNREHQYAGTCDLLMMSELGGGFKHIDAIIDFKTGEHINKKYCRVQLSLYRLALIEMGAATEDVRILIVNPSGHWEFEPMTWEEIVALDADNFVPTDEQEKTISRIEARMNALRPFVAEYEGLEKQLKDFVLETMQAANANKYSSADYSFTLVPASVRKSLDTARVKEALGERADEFMKETKVAAGIRIKPLNEGK